MKINNFDELEKALGNDLKKYVLEYLMVMIAKAEKYDQIEKEIDKLSIKKIKEIIDS